MKLTAKQESFISGIAAGKSQSDAYREAYDAGNMTPKQIWEEASKLASHPKVSQRLYELQEAARERTLVTVESLTQELNEARAIALSDEDAAELRQNTMAKAKLHGLDVHKIDASIGFNPVIKGDDADL